MKKILAILAVLFAPQDLSAETVLITGSNSGIGLEFAKQYAIKKWNVIATHRRKSEPESLVALRNKYPKLVRIETMDVSNIPQIDALAKKLNGEPIDILINNAGITGFFDGLEKQAFGSLDYKNWEEFMRINALGPLKVSEAFVENVKKSKVKVIVSISSLAGSFGFKGPNMPGGYWYKSSKTMLNMYMKNIASDLKKDGVTAVILTPGQVKVEKVAAFSSPSMIEPSVSIRGMIQVIESLTTEDSGSYFNYKGEVQPF